MTTSAITSSGSAGASTSSAATNQLTAFRQANFLQIILSEITNQDPLNPTDSSKMVESMQQLQSLANSTYEKFRADVTWAQQLTNKVVNVTQVAATANEVKGYKDAGLIPDVGYGNVDGRIDSFKVVNQTVWVSVNGKDYPLDNVKQVKSDAFDTNALVDSANRLLGMRVKYLSATGTNGQAEGIVTSVGYDTEGKVKLGLGDNAGYIGYDDVIAVTVPPKTTT